MRKIAILNFKGGTGKTTTAVNLSAALALKRQNVLVIDCDPQGSVADWLGVNPGNTFLDLLMDRVRLQDCIYQARDRLAIIPSDKKISFGRGPTGKTGKCGKSIQKKTRVPERV